MHVAAILYEADEGPQSDALLAGLAHRLKAQGVKLAGAVQSNVAVPNRSRCEIVLEDLSTGRTVNASEDRGPLASGCRLDAGALEDVVGLSAASLTPDTALVIVNKFSKRETEGAGFRPLIEHAVVLGVPVLVAVKRTHLPAWSAFVGSDPLLLPLDRSAVERWCEQAIARYRSEEEPRGG